MPDTEHIWEFNRALTGRLLRNNIVNVWLGNRLRASKSDFLRGIGTQAVGWGIINICIGTFGMVSTRRRLDKLDDPFDAQVVRRETRNIRLALLINTPLNLLYMLGGLRFAASAKDGDRYRKGNGWGIVLQGLMLFVHDMYHLLNIPPENKRKDQ